MICNILESDKVKYHEVMGIGQLQTGPAWLANTIAFPPMEQSKGKVLKCERGHLRFIIWLGIHN